MDWLSSARYFVLFLLVSNILGCSTAQNNNAQTKIPPGTEVQESIKKMLDGFYPNAVKLPAFSEAESEAALECGGYYEIAYPAAGYYDVLLERVLYSLTVQAFSESDDEIEDMGLFWGMVIDFMIKDDMNKEMNKIRDQLDSEMTHYIEQLQYFAEGNDFSTEHYALYRLNELDCNQYF